MFDKRFIGHHILNDFESFEPHELQKIFHRDKYPIVAGGRYSGKSWATAQLAKAFPRCKVIIPNLKAMDNMIGLGVQPSQLIMSSEFKNTSRLDMMSINGEGINDGGNP